MNMEVAEANLRRTNESSVGTTDLGCGLPNKTQEP